MDHSTAKYKTGMSEIIHNGAAKGIAIINLLIASSIPEHSYLYLLMIFPDVWVNVIIF